MILRLRKVLEGDSFFGEFLIPKVLIDSAHKLFIPFFIFSLIVNICVIVFFLFNTANGLLFTSSSSESVTFLEFWLFDFIPTILFPICVGTIVHEFGHYVGFCSYNIESKMFVGILRGETRCSDEKSKRLKTWQKMNITMMGCLSNFVFTLLIIPIYLLLPSLGIVNNIVFNLGIVSLLLGTFNLMPLSDDIDGKRLFEYWGEIKFSFDSDF